MLYFERPIVPIRFVSDRLDYLINNPPEFNEDSIEKLDGEVFTDLYYPQDPNIIPGRYKVSNMGRVYDVFSQTFIASCFSDGYNYFHLATVDSDTAKVRFGKYRTNRIVLSSFEPNDDMSNLHVHHVNNISTDNKVDNLQWTTPLENTNYAIEDGRFNMISTKEELDINTAKAICSYVKKGGSPEEAGVKYNVNGKIVYELVSGDIFPYLKEKYKLPEIRNIYKTRDNASSLTEYEVIQIKKDIINGMSEVDIMKKYDKPRHIISDIRHSKSYKDVDAGAPLPEIDSIHYLNGEIADKIGKLLSEGRQVKEVAQITGFVTATIEEIKRGTKFPEVKEKYNLDDVKVYNEPLTDERIIKEVIPDMLSKKFRNDIEIANKYNCSSAQIRDLRLHRRRTHLTEGIDFTGGYIKDGRKPRVSDDDIKIIKAYIEDHPEIKQYDQIVKALLPIVPNVTYNVVQSIKLNKCHVDNSSEEVKDVRKKIRRNMILNYL